MTQRFYFEQDFHSFVPNGCALSSIKKAKCPVSRDTKTQFNCANCSWPMCTGLAPPAARVRSSPPPSSSSPQQRLQPADPAARYVTTIVAGYRSEGKGDFHQVCAAASDQMSESDALLTPVSLVSHIMAERGPSERSQLLPTVAGTRC